MNKIIESIRSRFNRGNRFKAGNRFNQPEAIQIPRPPEGFTEEAVTERRRIIYKCPRR